MSCIQINGHYGRRLHARQSNAVLRALFQLNAEYYILLIDACFNSRVKKNGIKVNGL